jgi:hypothetical protein
MERELNIIDHTAQLHCLVRYKSQCYEATQNVFNDFFFKFDVYVFFPSSILIFYVDY